MKLGTWVLTAMTLLGAMGQTAATTPPGPQEDGLTPLTRAWVDPAFGSDPAPSASQVNNPSTPYKTIQRAIDDVHLSLRAQYLPPSNTNVRGLVYCLPGLYGPHTQTTPSSGDTFPIYMRDRVNLQGLGADTCIIRGDSSANPPQVPIFWPDPSLCPQSTLCSHPDKQVLIDFRESGQNHPAFPPSNPMPAPWVGMGDYTESIDGFSFQGGDVQVLFQTTYWISSQQEPISGRITNCVFDMRHGWTAYVQGSGGAVTGQVAGPYFGVMMAKAFHDPPAGYFDQKVLIANNTFILAEWNSGGTWTNSRDFAVGIIDVTDVGCLNFPLACPNQNPPDPNNSTLRGLGKPGIMNNVFRTWPGNQQPGTGHMAMLGIDSQDTQLIIGSTPGQDTNAFAPGRVGASNQMFSSVPRVSYPVGTVPGIGTLYNDDAGDPAPALPLPKVALWAGVTPVPAGEVDPGFVGEFLKLIPGLGIPNYRDWRLIPSSPLENAGLFDKTTGISTFSNWTSFSEPSDSELRSFDYDGEGYGNPRVVGSAIDIGFDEAHLMIMTGCYGADSRSFAGSGFLNPSAVGGSHQRIMILPKPTGLTPQTFTFHGAYALPGNTPPPALPGWAQPPGTLSPALFVPQAGVLREYRMQYISFNDLAQDPPPPTPWIAKLPPVTPPELELNNTFTMFPSWVLPIGNAQGFNFWLTGVVDPEGAQGIVGPNTYFNLQVDLMWTSGENWWSNVQVEYR